MLTPGSFQGRDQQDDDAHHGQHGTGRGAADGPVAAVIGHQKVISEPLQ